MKQEVIGQTGTRVQMEKGAIIKGWVQKQITLPSALANGTYVVTVMVNNEIYRAKLAYAH